MTTTQFELGIMGLGTMGRNLALNCADHGYFVAGFDVGAKAVESFNAAGEGSQKIKGFTELKDFVGSLKAPRAIVILVPASVVDTAIESLLPLLQEGDILIDSGNSHYVDTDRRIKLLQDKKLHFMGMGISGGEEGARFGPSMMPGGNKTAYERIRPVLEAVCAKVNDEPCVAYMGEGSAGHYVKMVHNGIEYGIMQLLAESYDFMKHGLGLSNERLHSTFQHWSQGPLKGFLMEITAEIFTHKDDETQGFLIDKILDAAKQKGTGMWASQDAMSLHVPIPTIDTAVCMRDLSVLKADRVVLSNYCPSAFLASRQSEDPSVDATFIDQLELALGMAILVTYAQGMSLIKVASEAYQYNINLSKVAKIWRGGCIIRSNLLEPIAEAFEKNAQLSTLLLDESLKEWLRDRYKALCDVMAKGIEFEIPLAAFSSSLAYYQAYHRASLPSNLIQAQRDYFGAHTYERLDKPGTFHTQWNPEIKKEANHALV
jgi:6-phosphogluconate dehydrogenase